MTPRSIHWSTPGTLRLVAAVLVAGVALPTSLAGAAGASTPAVGMSATIESAEPALDPNVTIGLIAAVSGEIGPYQCSWTDSLGEAAVGCGFLLHAAAPGTVNVSLSVTDDLGGSAQAQRSFTVHPAPNVTLVDPPTGGDVGQPISLTAQTTGGTPPTGLHWTLLPEGTNGSANLAGAGPFGFTVVAADPGVHWLTARLVDAFGVASTATVRLGTFGPSPSTTWWAGVNATDAGSTVIEQAGLGGGSPPWDVAVASDLPLSRSVVSLEPGNASTVVVWNGSWSVPGNASLAITVTDGHGEAVALERTVAVAAPPAIRLVSTCAVDFAGQSCPVVVNVSGGTGPFSVGLFGAGGLQDSATLAADGTLTLPFVPGGPAPFAFTVVLEDSVGTSAHVASELPVLPGGAGPGPSAPDLRPLAALAALPAGIVAVVLWRRHRRDGRAAPAAAGLLEEILHSAQDADRASLELLARDHRLSAEQLDRELRAAVERGDLRTEEGPDGETLYTWAGRAAAGEPGGTA